MNLPIDKDCADGAENSRAVLAGWLDDYIAGRCERADMQESLLSVCRSNSDAPWDALALLDQYQRRGRIDMALARSLKTDIAQLVFGNANQTEPAREPALAVRDASGTRWRKLLEPVNPAPTSPPTQDFEQASADPIPLRREAESIARPLPVVKVREKSAPPPRTIGVGDVLRERYELLSMLGRGSSGTVYKALDRHRAHLPEAARCVAVKVLKLDYRDRPEALAELEREFHQAQSLAHPNVVNVFDLDRDGGTYFIVMELLEGELLADVLQRLDGRAMQREQALAIVSSIGAALAHAHRRDIVHADLKPRNVMITAAGEVRVLDFGFSRHRALELHNAIGLDAAPASAPAYASVERVNGSEPHSSDDLYSLACIAYQLLSGEHPFGGRSAVLARAHGRRPKNIPGLSRTQMQALNRALLWIRGERQIDVIELLDALGCAGAADKLVPPQMLLVTDTQGARQRLRVLTLIAFMLIVGATTAVFIYLERESSSLQGTARKQPAASVTEPDAASEDAAIEEPVAGQPPTASLAGSEQGRQTASPPPASAQMQASVTAPPATRQSNAAIGQIAIEFDKDTYVATESDGSARIVVQRRGPAGRAVGFRWHLRSNSAEQGSDFAGIGPGAERIAAGASSASIIVPLVSDAVVENTEVFLVEIEPDQPGVVAGERSHAAVIIVDDD